MAASFILGALVVILPIGTVMLVQGAKQARIVRQVEDLLEANVEAGDSPTAVLKVLDSARITHGGYKRDSRTVSGILHDTAFGPFYNAHLVIEFHFSTRHTLIWYTVEEEVSAI